MFLNVHVSFHKNNDGSRLFGELQDEVSIDCADFSDEKRDALIAELSRKVTKAWAYMSDRQSSFDPKPEAATNRRKIVPSDPYGTDIDYEG